MPTRLLTSSVLKWPDAATVVRAARSWAAAAERAHPEVRRIGYAGSYARGDWGVGSDLDLVIVVRDAPPPPSPLERALAFDAADLPVPADVLVFTESEWRAATAAGRHLSRQTVWLTPAAAAAP